MKHLVLFLFALGFFAAPALVLSSPAMADHHMEAADDAAAPADCMDDPATEEDECADHGEEHGDDHGDDHGEEHGDEHHE